MEEIYDPSVELDRLLARLQAEEEKERNGIVSPEEEEQEMKISITLKKSSKNTSTIVSDVP